MLEDISQHQGVFEFSFGFLLLFSIIFIAFVIKKSEIMDTRKEYYFFVRGLSLKLIGGFLFAIVYVFYYGFGDTHVYFISANEYLKFILDNPTEGLKLYFETSRHLKETSYAINSGNDIFTLPGGRNMPFYYSPDFFTMSKIIVPISFFCFRSYFSSTIIFATLSFTGLWRMYLTFCKICPQKWKQMGYAFFYIPSIFFWGSGIMKDSITICMLGFVISLSYEFFFENKRSLLRILFFLFCSYILMVLKGYILLSILPGIFIWVYLSKTNEIKNAFFRLVVTPILFTLISISAFYLIIELSKTSDKYAVGQLTQTAETYQKWHSELAVQDGGGSYYSLGEADFSLTGMIKKFPAALNVTFFRPYLWEVRSPIMAISGLESLLIFYFTIFLLFKIKIYPFFGIIFKNPEILMLFLFTLVLGFAVGFTTYNFGALARYKIPCLLTYVLMLILIDAKAQEKIRRQNVESSQIN